MFGLFRRKLPPGIGWLAEDLRRAKAPTDKELKRGVDQELAFPVEQYPGPNYGLCAIAAALLNDLPLWRRVVTNDKDRDYFYYRRQQGYGVEEEDLGRFPTFAVSVERVSSLATSALSSLEVRHSAEILRRIETFAQSGE